jgi:hypothetical protein
MEPTNNCIQEGYGIVQCKFELKIIDINDSEATIETFKCLELNREYTFKIFINGSCLNAKGRTMWSFLTQRKENGDLIPVYKTGITFIREGKNKKNNLY